MRKAWVVVLAVIFIAGAAIVARRGGRLRTKSSAQGGNSQSDSQRTASDSKTTVAVSSAGSSAAIEISKHGPGMRRQPPESLKLPVPRTFDLKHVDPANFAAALGNDPDRIFNYLRDEIAYEVYTGSLRGPRGTLLAMSGNSVDRASLLASMLQHAGQRVRFAQGTLPEPQARELVSSMWAERSDPALADVDVKPSQSLSRDLDVLFNGVKRDYTLIRDHLKEVNLKITPEPAPSLDSLVKETQNHYWIQWFKNGTWLDLDPSFADSSPGEEYATAERTFDVLSDDLFHQVEIRIRIEEYTGDQVSSRDDQEVSSGHAATATRSTGRLMTTSVPSCGRLRTSIRPRCSSTIFLVIASPKPIPSFLVVKYGLKIRLRSSSLMPDPVSEIVTSTVP